jgi:hypothetical protein
MKQDSLGDTVAQRRGTVKGAVRESRTGEPLNNRESGNRFLWVGGFQEVAARRNGPGENVKASAS